MMHVSDTATSARILFVCDADTAGAVSALQTCHLLCEALAAAGLQPTVLQAWPQSAAHSGGRVAAKMQERPYTVYGSRAVHADAALLALVEQPTVAITLGSDPIALAQGLLDGGLPCIAWFCDANGLGAIPPGALDRRLGLAAATQALADRLSTGLGTAVSTLVPPLAPQLRLSNGGNAILVPGIRRVDGIARVLEIARARPQVPFVAIAGPGQEASAQALLASAPPNLSVLPESRAARTAFRMAVLPALSADLPWDMLAHGMAAGIPVLASSDPLLEDAIGDAGMVVPASRPTVAWLTHFDQMLQDDTLLGAMVPAAIDRALGLRLPAAQAAQACLQRVAQHLRPSGRPLHRPI